MAALNGPGARLLTALALVIVVLLPAGVQAQGAEETFAFAEGLYGQENYQLALEKYTAFLQQHPDHANASLATFRAGECNFRLDRYAEAARWFEQLTERFPESEEAEPAWLWLGDARFKTAEYEAAAAAYASLLERFPDSQHAPTAAYWRGESLYHLGRFQEAADAYADALDRGLGEHEKPYALYSIGLCRMQLEQPGPAAEHFSRVVEEHPASPVAAESRYLLGNALRAQQKYPEALAAYQAVLANYAQSPFAAWAQSGIAGTYFQQGDYAKAREAWEELIARFPDSEASAEARLRIADSYYHQEQWQRAAELYEAIVAEGGQWAPEARFWLGVSQLKRGRSDEALSIFQALITNHPQHPRVGDAWLRIAEIRSASGAHDAAMAAYESALQAVQDPERRAQINLAMRWARYQQTQSQEALAELEQAVRDDPTASSSAELALRIARVHFDAGHYDRAREMLDLLARHHPKSRQATDGKYLLAAIHERTGDTEAASALYQQILEQAGESGSSGYAAAALAGIHAERGEIDQARELIARMEREGADPASIGFALYRTAEALRRAERPEEALALYNRSVEIAPDADSAPYARAGAGWCRLGSDLPGAIEAFRGVLADSPGSGAVPVALQGLVAAAQKLFDAEDYAQADQIYASIIEGFPEAKIVGDAQYGRAWALLRQDKSEQALPLFRAAIENASSPAMVVDARYQAARLLAGRGDHAAAVALLEPLRSGAEDAERLPWAMLLLAQSHLELDQPEQAASVLTTALGQWPEHEIAARANLALGRSYRALNRPSDAIGPLRSAVGGGDGAIAARARYELGEAIRESGDLAGAAEELLKVAILHPESEWAPVAQFAAGQCYEQLGQTGNAVTSYKVIVRQYEDAQEWVARARTRIEQLQQ